MNCSERKQDDQKGIRKVMDSLLILLSCLLFLVLINIKVLTDFFREVVVSMTLRLKQIGHLRNVSLVHFSECIQLSELLVKKRFVAYVL